MKKYKISKRTPLLAVIILVSALFISCSSGSDLPTQVSGSWQQSEGKGSVEINLVKAPLSIMLDNKLFPARIKSIDKGSYSMHLDVETEPGLFEDWILRQVWDDNGSNFTLSLNHNGTEERLVSRQPS